ncbi:MAG: hypothetical protein GF331_12445 [Chitinivibrionales bacterium]|nr:hypothetical protein [Chitinivibrionales bacterium]
MSQIQVQLDSDAVRPGQELTGTVSWSLQQHRGDRIVVRVFWYTQGKGTEDLGVVDEKTIPSPATAATERFSFRVPAFPWSYAGTLMAITWAVEATVEPKGAVDRKQFVLGPNGQEVHA